MAGTDTAPGAQTPVRTHITHQTFSWTGPSACPASRLVRLERGGPFSAPRIKAIWLSEKGNA